ncbi:type II toxin-antitoxin system HicA family toxin [Thiolinea disciformis]|uniref:type II toxin-antitoxin system HicA family toxin n=1 Tax=Thiolinea disciformis TaxID=125614 RepID=UPI000372894F|nr:type II toxin-antitoxin system HicA family toxin [Thiolinea disciformis]
MTKLEKLLEKMANPDTTWTWKELCSLLKKLGYTQEAGDGSRVKFDNGNATDLINLHKPHPSNEVKAYVIRQVREKLQNGGML